MKIAHIPVLESLDSYEAWSIPQSISKFENIAAHRIVKILAPKRQAHRVI